MIKEPYYNIKGKMYQSIPLNDSNISSFEKTIILFVFTKKNVSNIFRI